MHIGAKLFLTYSYYLTGQLIPCISTPCKNGGSCFPIQSNKTDYRCSCTEEFTGQNCTERKFNFLTLLKAILPLKLCAPTPSLTQHVIISQC